MIDLRINESPYPPSEKVIKALKSNLNQLNRYIKSSEVNDLRKAMAEYCGVNEERILVGPGTDYLIVQAISRLAKGRDVVVFNPTTSQSIESVRYAGGRVVRIQLIPPKFQIDWNELGSNPSLILIDYPSNPTGQCLITREQLITLLTDDTHLILIDEAGYEYSGKTFVDLVKEYPNLAVTRTLDKAFGLAGLRVSWMVAGDYFLKVLKQNEMLINRPTCAGALAALEDKEYAIECAKMTVLEQKRLEKNLTLLGIEVFPSESNYLLIKTGISDFALYLKKSGILVQDLSSTWLPGFYHLCVGTNVENDALINVIKEKIDKDKYQTPNLSTY